MKQRIPLQLKWGLRHPREAVAHLLDRLARRLRRERTHPPLAATSDPVASEWHAIVQRAARATDISDHLVTLFSETLALEPKLIVELGVRGGESTFVLERVARLCGGTLVSVDICDCADVSRYERAFFVQADDIAFAGEFGEWCRARGIQPKVDVLFVDTSHELDHSVEEISCWFPFLAPRAKAIFHDTNLSSPYFRKDGSMGFAWNNARGVVGALERYLGTRLDEKTDFVEVIAGWLVKHHAHCNGLTILDRISALTRSAIH
ncbi:MAG: class I SAM-dependent methyltransferase [Kiritimatiellae bacterium]|nr:class I SAM-dependent methyltransferase [Kiritimatiellia bacterium]